VREMRDAVAPIGSAARDARRPPCRSGVPPVRRGAGAAGRRGRSRAEGSPSPAGCRGVHVCRDSDPVPARRRHCAGVQTGRSPERRRAEWPDAVGPRGPVRARRYRRTGIRRCRDRPQRPGRASGGGTAASAPSMSAEIGPQFPRQGLTPTAHRRNFSSVIHPHVVV
jgi:hypothetical protein